MIAERALPVSGVTSNSAPSHNEAYSKSDLLGEARRRGYHVTSSLFDDWVGHGLLDRGAARGRGQGRGKDYRWSVGQRELFVLLLKKRRSVARIRPLANVPVWIWLVRGDDWIPLRQVRRAMETWAEVSRPSPRHDYRAAATSLVATLARPDASQAACRTLVEALVESARTRRFEPGLLDPLLTGVVGAPDATAQLDGPRTSRLLALGIEARLRFHEANDEAFRWAQAVYRYTRARYGQERATLAVDPRFGSLHADGGLEATVNEACQDLLRLIGFWLSDSEASGLPPSLRPGAWRARV